MKYNTFWKNKLPEQAPLNSAMPNRRIQNPKVELHTSICNIKMNVQQAWNWDQTTFGHIQKFL